LKRPWIIIVALILISLSAAFMYKSSSSGDSGPAVLYIPLDNRPVNYQNALALGELAGFNLACPAQEQLANHSQLNNWLAEEADRQQATVTSLDMLLYGGLVESRKHDLAMPELANRVNAIKTLKNGDKPVYAFISVMRAPMANTPHTMPDYYAKHGVQIYKYGELLDKKNLDIIKPAEVQKLSELTKAIPEAYLKDFTVRRDKNYQATEQVLKLVQQDYIDRLVISKDDTAPYGFTRRETERLDKLVQQYQIADKVQFITGTDECGQVLLAALANQLDGRVDDKAPQVYVDYAHPSLAGNIPLYEDVPLQQNVKLHIEATGAATAAQPNGADLILAVHNGPGQGQDFIERINQYTAQGIPVTIADVNYPNMADTAFMATLNKSCDLSQLAGYSGWNTAGNSIGLALSQGLLSTTHPGHPEQRDVLLKSLLEDWGYQAVVRPVIKEKVPVEQQTLLTDRELEEQITADITKRLNAFAQRNLREDFGDVEVTEVNLPWHRLFDVDFGV